MKSIRLVIVVALVAGCIEPPSDGNATTASDLLAEGETVLLATSTFMSHAGAGSVTAVPRENVSAPSSCAIFRQGNSYEEDSCAVRDGGDFHVEAPWHVEASFAGSGYPIDSPRRWWEKTIEAYNPAGDLVATWDGQHDYHPQHRRAIE